MRRRSYLRLGTVAAVGLAGCTAIGGFEAEGGADGTPTPDCPALLDRAVTVCPHRDGGPLTVERTGGTVSRDQWSLAVAVTNRASSPYRFDPDGWAIARPRGDGWTQVVPPTAVGQSVELAPGDRYQWGLTTGGPLPDDVDHRVVIDLQPGEYGFVVPFRGPVQVGVVAPLTIDG